MLLPRSYSAKGGGCAELGGVYESIFNRVPADDHARSGTGDGVLVQKSDPSDRSEERRPGRGPLIHPDTSPAKRSRPQDQLSCNKKYPLEPDGKLNRRECEQEPVHLNDAVASACVPVKRRTSNGGRSGYSLHLSFVCPRRGDNRRIGIV